MAQVERRVLSGPLTFVDVSGNELLTIDPAKLQVQIPTGSSLRVGGIAQVTDPVGSLLPGLRVVAGIHQQAAAADTIVTGLTTVAAVVVGFQDAPTVKQLTAGATIGDQAGAPAAGSIIIHTYKPTAVNDVTPAPATDFSDNIHLAWIAFGS